MEILKHYGTEGYEAPEILNRVGPHKTYKGVQADIYSLAVIFFIMKFGKPPFGKASLYDTNYKLYLKNPQAFWRCHPAVRRCETVDNDFKDLIINMFSANLQVRQKSMTEVISHVYFTKDNLTDV